MYHYSWLELIPGAMEGLEHSLGLTSGQALAILGSWTICIVLVLVALVARAGLNAAIARGGTAQYVPDHRLSLRNTFELLVEGLDGLFQSILGRADARGFFWLLGGLFTYILASNLMGIVPGLLPPTDNINTNMAMALVVLITFNAVGISRQGFVPYFKHLLGPVWWLSPLLFLVEFLGLFVVRPVSLSLRLTGNIFGDHLVFGIMSQLTHGIVIPFIFLGLGIFVSFIQALVFTLLTSVYIAVAAIKEDHGDHHGDHHESPGHT